MPTTSFGSQLARIAEERAPVPQATSSHLSPDGSANQSTNRGAMARLQCPTYLSLPTASFHMV
jgi:hypothetical protein